MCERRRIYTHTELEKDGCCRSGKNQYQLGRGACVPNQWLSCRYDLVVNTDESFTAQILNDEAFSDVHSRRRQEEVE